MQFLRPVSVFSVLAFGAILALTGTVAAAQTAKVPAPAAAAPAPAAAAPAAAAQAAPAPAAEQAEAPPQPYRTEILNIESWTVTCQDFLLPKPRRICGGQLRVVRQGTAQVIMALNIGYDEASHLKATMTTPTGVNVAKGIDFIVGAAPAHKLTYETCDASQCTANFALDDKLSKELQAASAVDVVLTAPNGSTIKVNFGVKGFDKALAAMAVKP